FGVILCIGAAVVVTLAYLLARTELPAERRRSLARTLGLCVLVGGFAAFAVVLVARGGGILDEFRGAKTAEVTQTPNRLADLSSSNRWTWWQEAGQVLQDGPAGGRRGG